MQNSRIPELVIEKGIMAEVYSFRQDIFRHKTRFQMIFSQPNERIKFQKVKSVFKGRFICKNDACLQQKRENGKGNARPRRQSQQKDHEQQREQNRSWMKWWDKQYKQICSEDKTRTQNKKKQSRTQKLDQKKRDKKQNDFENTKEENKQKQNDGYQNSRWSSSLTFVNFYYYSYPVSLDRLLRVYEREPKTKCEIYFYVELMGQKCKKCKSEEFCYPFFGKTELKRSRKNFSSFIYNSIYNKPILRYKPCKLRRLKDHQRQLCQACELGQCGIRDI